MPEVLRLINPNGDMKEIKRILNGDLPARSYLEQFRPASSLYLRPDATEGIHGDGHSARVSIWTQVLHRILDRRGIETDAPALACFAGSHDLGRLADENDPGHGTRSALIVLDGAIPFISLPLVEQVAFLDTWHDPHDIYAPAMTATLAAAKDADAVDRCREEGAFDPRFLRYPESHLLVKPAQVLHALSIAYRTQYGLSSFNSVMQAGVDLGLVSDT